MSTLPVRFAWSKVIPRGGCFDGLSDLDEIFPSVKTDLNSDRRISPSSVGKYVHGILEIMHSATILQSQSSNIPIREAVKGHSFFGPKPPDPPFLGVKRKTGTLFISKENGAV